MLWTAQLCGTSRKLCKWSDSSKDKELLRIAFRTFESLLERGYRCKNQDRRQCYSFNIGTLQNTRSKVADFQNTVSEYVVWLIGTEMNPYWGKKKAYLILWNNWNLIIGCFPFTLLLHFFTLIYKCSKYSNLKL